MRWLVTIAVLILVAGPLRKCVLSDRRFFAPALVAGLVSWILLSTVMRPPEAWMEWALPPLVGFGVAVAFRPLIEDLFGKGK